MPENDAAYFRRRAIEEQVAAQKATCKAACERHEELATMYRFRSFMLTTHPDRWSEALQSQTEAA